MSRIVSVGLLLALAVLVAAPLLAADKAERKQKKAAATPRAVTAVLKQVETVGLSEEQSKKVKELTAQYEPKLAAAQKKVAAALTVEQRKARADAAAKAKADGQKGKAAQASIQAALKLTAEQQTAFDTADKESKEVVQAFRKAVADVLTTEQKAKTDLEKGKKGKTAKKAKKAK